MTDGRTDICDCRVAFATENRANDTLKQKNNEYFDMCNMYVCMLIYVFIFSIRLSEMGYY